MEERRILAISLGTRIMGIAVVENGKYTEWRIKQFKAAWSPQKQQAMLVVIDKLIAKYAITHLVLKNPSKSEQSPVLSEMINEINEKAIERKALFSLYTINDMKQLWSQSERCTKGRLMQEILRRHPFLKHEYERELNIKHRYYERLFEAVALAGMVYQEF